jgi:hypothetical protein
MWLSVLDDTVARTGTTRPIEAMVRIEALPLDKTALNLHDEEAVGVPARRSLLPVLHAQSPHRPK